MVTNGNEKNSKKLQKFICETCYFTCSNKQDYTRHLSTGKHEMIINGNEKNSKKLHIYTCSCGKIYKHISGLSRHKKKCNFEEIKNDVVEVEYEVIELGNAVVEVDSEENEYMTKGKDETIDELKNEIIEIRKEMKEMKELKEPKEMKENTPTVNELLKQNSEILAIMKTMVPKIGNTTNNNNNTFNLNVFLNETCKDAVNIRDFINSLRVQCNEMKEIQNIGFVEVASKLLIKELSGMDITKRPIHCSDLKRETLYIKDNDVWGKESENKPTMLHMISQMQKESYTALDNWATKHPGYIKPDHPCHQTYMDTWGDICTLDPVKDVNKISKRIAKEVLIDKERTTPYKGV